MRAALVDMLWQILECWKCYIVVTYNIGTRALPETCVRTRPRACTSWLLSVTTIIATPSVKLWSAHTI